jgi:2-keto-4-pentenoate hydratase/2-oxohepta-3-ene-1,7-dioic acid hydratase in catechol pathway
LLGHEATACFPPREDEPDFEVGLAVILGEDLRRATPRDAQRAILGYSILNNWTARQEERRGSGSRARDFATQLGPILLTTDEIGEVGDLRVTVRVGSQLLPCSTAAGNHFTIPECIAFVSDHVDLCAGDVIGAGCVKGGSAAAHQQRLPYESPVEVTVERIGKLAGRATRGPEPVWRGQAERTP